MIARPGRVLLCGLMLLASACQLSIADPSASGPIQPSRADGLSHAGHASRDALGGLYGIGRSPTTAEIDAWNIDIMPDGEGLPSGSGNVADGRALYASQCQRCHGAEGRGGPFDELAGRLPKEAFPFAMDPRAKHTIGNYWPYATTIFDYTRRAMPQDRPGSLGDEEVYALTAYLLYLNELVDENATLDRETLPRIVMPSRDRFIPDDRQGGPEIR